MKRYSTTSIRSYSPAEDPAGEFVRYEDAAQRIAELEARCQAKDDRIVNQSTRIAELESEIKDYRRQIKIYRELEAEHEKDAEQWQFACDHWPQLIKMYMHSGFEGPTLESLVEVMREGEG